MKIKSEELISSLIERTRNNMNQAEAFRSQSLEHLNFKETEKSWSVLECLAHLNLYGDFYLPEMEQRISSSKYSANENFKSGWLGNYFANLMLPESGEIKKMSSPKDKIPNGSQLNLSVLDKFQKQQQKTLELLNKARKVNLEKTKSSITISKWITLKLGDTFRFLINHNKRHLMQADRALEKAG